VPTSDGTNNQTFIKTNVRQDTKYYDLHMSRVQILWFWPALNLERSTGRRLTLTDAAKLMYDEASVAEKARMRESDPDLVHGCRTILLAAAVQGIVTLHGRRAPGLRHEPITKKEIDGLWVLNEADRLFEPIGDKPVFIDIELQADDMRRALDALESEIA
jgi:hypothetical protein